MLTNHNEPILVVSMFLCVKIFYFPKKATDYTEIFYFPKKATEYRSTYVFHPFISVRSRVTSGWTTPFEL